MEQEQDEALETRYFAEQRLKVGANLFRERGEEIPEAASWNELIRVRYLQEDRISEIRIMPRRAGRPRKDYINA